MSAYREGGRCASCPVSRQTFIKTGCLAGAAGILAERESLYAQTQDSKAKIRIIYSLHEQGPRSMHLYVPDLDLLRDFGEKFRRELALTPNVVHTRTKLREGQPKLLLQANEEKLSLTVGALAFPAPLRPNLQPQDSGG